MALFIPNSKLGRVRNEFALDLTAKYGRNAYEVHSTLEKVGIGAIKVSYSYFMDILSPLDKGTVLSSEQLDGLYAAAAQKYNVTCKRVFDSMRYAIGQSWTTGEIAALVSMFGEKRIHKINPPGNLEYINAVLKYSSEIKDEIVEFEL